MTCRRSTHRAIRLLAPALAAATLLCLASSASAATAAPAWRLLAASAPTNLPPGGTGTILVYATNVGGADAAGPIRATVSLPAGVTSSETPPTETGWACLPAGLGQANLSCTYGAGVRAGLTVPPLLVRVQVAAGAVSGVGTVSVSGGGAAVPVTYDEAITVSSAPAAAGVQAFWAGSFDADGRPSTQAGGHPAHAATAFVLNTIVSPSGEVIPAGDPRDVTVELPPGFLGNPLATARCLPDEPARCGRPETVVGEGETLVRTFREVERGERTQAGYLSPLYNDIPPSGYPAQFALLAFTTVVPVLGELRSDGDYGIDATAPTIPQTLKVFGSFISLFGTPPNGGGKAFLTNPSDCAEQARSAPVTTVRSDSWQHPGDFDSHSDPSPAVVGCDRLGPLFQPTLTFRPATGAAASPTAFSAELRQPQAGLTDPSGLAAPPLKKAVVTLPPGVDVNPSSANGLETCSEAQIGLTTTTGAPPAPIRFDKSEPTCPEASKLGTVEARSPLLEEALAGTIYLAAQEENPFGSLLALYLVIDSPQNGILVKLPGEVRADASSGQLTATFDDNPQLPVEDLKLSFRGGGPRSPLATPAVCGTYTTHGQMTPWSAPESGPPVATADSFQVTAGPGGRACATSESGLPFAPRFEAGTTSAAAGAYAPLVLTLARGDGEAELTHLDFTLPAGLTARLAGIPYCGDAEIAAAASRSGSAERTDPSCAAASAIGTVDTAAGLGPEPIHVPGRVYLAGPYRGAPLSAVVITPAVAGPFDLGTVVVRAPLFVNPETAQITARSDEIPHILRGIPLQLRSVQLKIDRPEFSLNPTNCDPLAVTASMSGLNGATASRASRFQVGNCAALPFRPRLKLRVIGKTNRNAKPRLKAVLTAAPGEAGIRRAQVNLPHSEFLEQNHIKTVCTRVQFAAGDGNGSACPRGSIYGRAKAWTPLLERPLEGNVYLRSNGGERKLPDLVAALDGQIDIALWGKVDSGPNKGIRNTFEVVPDAPVSRFLLEMAGNKRGLLVNSEDLCSKRAKRRAIVRLVGQNGKVRMLKPLVARRCKKRGGAGGSR